jgi:hypothetical protein
MTDNDWVVTVVVDTEKTTEEIVRWEVNLSEFDGSIARVPDWGIHATLYMPGKWPLRTAVEQAIREIDKTHGVGPAPRIDGAYAIRESDYRRISDMPKAKLLSTTESLALVGVSRSRFCQLRSTDDNFPKPAAILGKRPLWDERAMQKYALNRNIKPGRSKTLEPVTA